MKYNSFKQYSHCNLNISVIYSYILNIVCLVNYIIPTIILIRTDTYPCKNNCMYVSLNNNYYIDRCKISFSAQKLFSLRLLCVYTHKRDTIRFAGLLFSHLGNRDIQYILFVCPSLSCHNKVCRSTVLASREQGYILSFIT